MATKWNFDPNDVTLLYDPREFEDLMKRLETELSGNEISGVFGIMKSQAKKMQNYAKRNRPWTDRTGEAKRRLYGDVYAEDQEITAFIGHGVFYGVSLELDHQRRYAILERARDYYVKDTLRLINDLLIKT